VQGCLFIQEAGGDELAFTSRVYKAHFEENLNVEDVSVLVKCAAQSGVTDISAFETALKNATYEKAMLDANDYAYELKGVWAVPTFVCGDIRLDAVGGVGITKQQLDAFFEKCCQ
jgi:predicted DsbA family dithiol-disulfide isomerase